MPFTASPNGVTGLFLLSWITFCFPWSYEFCLVLFALCLVFNMPLKFNSRFCTNCLKSLSKKFSALCLKGSILLFISLWIGSSVPLSTAALVVWTGPHIAALPPCWDLGLLEPCPAIFTLTLLEHMLVVAEGSCREVKCWGHVCPTSCLCESLTWFCPWLLKAQAILSVEPPCVTVFRQRSKALSGIKNTQNKIPLGSVFTQWLADSGLSSFGNLCSWVLGIFLDSALWLLPICFLFLKFCRIGTLNFHRFSVLKL